MTHDGPVQKRKHQLRSLYALGDDTISIQHVVLCFDQSNGFKRPVPVQTDPDSILKHLKTAFHRLQLPLKFHDHIQFHCDSAISRDRNIRLWPLASAIIEQINNTDGRYQMVPVVRLLYWDFSTIGVALSSGAPTGGYKRDPMLAIGVHLLDHNIPIYTSMFSHWGRTLDLYTDEGYEIPTYQEQWDKLAELVMRDLKVRLR